MSNPVLERRAAALVRIAELAMRAKLHLERCADNEQSDGNALVYTRLVNHLAGELCSDLEGPCSPALPASSNLGGASTVRPTA